MSRAASWKLCIRGAWLPSRPVCCEGQAMLEYAVLIGIVTAAILGMQVYAKRGIQAGLRMTADSISPFAPDDPEGEKAQVAGMRYETGGVGEAAAEVLAAGTVLDNRTAVRSVMNRSVNTKTTLGGGVTKSILSDSVQNAGQLPDGPGVSRHVEVILNVE